MTNRTGKISEIKSVFPFEFLKRSFGEFVGVCARLIGDEYEIDFVRRGIKYNNNFSINIPIAALDEVWRITNDATDMQVMYEPTEEYFQFIDTGTIICLPTMPLLPKQEFFGAHFVPNGAVLNPAGIVEDSGNGYIGTYVAKVYAND